MRRLLYIPLVLVCLLSCKEDSDRDAMQPAITAFRSVSGTWHSVEIERSSLDNKNAWEQIPAAKSDTLVFRTDGVVLNANGTPRCCAPASLIINGELADIKPQSMLPNNPQCELLNCITCPAWEISMTADQMIISTCSSPRVKYVR